MKQITRHILYNALRTPDGHVLVSRSVHDYRIWDDANGKQYMIDGGREYIRRSANGDEEDLTLYTDDPHEKLREVFTWTSFGIDGDKSPQNNYLKDLSDSHIKAILVTQSHMPDYMRLLFKTEQRYRLDGDVSTNSIQE